MRYPIPKFIIPLAGGKGKNVRVVYESPPNNLGAQYIPPLPCNLCAVTSCRHRPLLRSRHPLRRPKPHLSYLLSNVARRRFVLLQAEYRYIPLTLE
jgi:hypothetical protein